MSVSSKYSKADTTYYDFSSIEMIVKLCNQHKIEIAVGATIYFPKGWKDLLIEFTSILKQYRVVLIDVTDSYGQLDIKFKMKAKKGELQVWRLIESLRLKSHNTCMLCGLESYMVSVSGTHKKVCDACYKESTKGSTGTWLDKYD